MIVFEEDEEDEAKNELSADTNFSSSSSSLSVCHLD